MCTHTLAHICPYPIIDYGPFIYDRSQAQLYSDI